MFHLVWYHQPVFLRAVRSICDTLRHNHFGCCAMITTMHDLHIALPYHHTQYPLHLVLVYPLTGQVPHVIDHLPLFYRE